MMKRNFRTAAGIALLMLATTLVTSCKGPVSETGEAAGRPDTLWLFNNTDLTGWKFFHREDVDPATVWTVSNGILHCKGEPFGYAKTDRHYSEYQLHVEWRWPGEPTNSGVFIHLQDEDAIWPVCFEAQMMHGRAGDLIAMGDGDFNERIDKSRRVVQRLTEESQEKPVGEWNTYRVIARGDSLEVFVNGMLQNKASGLNYTSGRIGLQSEGGPIEFRNVYLLSEQP
jgi:hypothetical protein